VTDEKKPTHEECVEIALQMYQQARVLATSGHPYFGVRGRDLMAELHNVVRTQAPFRVVPHIVDVI
jgi:hypothetical protein